MDGIESSIGAVSLRMGPAPLKGPRPYVECGSARGQADVTQRGLRRLPMRLRAADHRRRDGRTFAPVSGEMDPAARCHGPRAVSRRCQPKTSETRSRSDDRPRGCLDRLHEHPVGSARLHGVRPGSGERRDRVLRMRGADRAGQAEVLGARRSEGLTPTRPRLSGPHDLRDLREPR